MMHNQFKSPFEKLFASYLDNLGLGWDYEKKWGTKKPDFTIYSDSTKKIIISVAEVEDMDLTPEEKRQFKENGMISKSMNPYSKLREKINVARDQLKYAKDFPCLLIIGKNIGLDTPIITYGAMLGDFTISVPVRTDNTPLKEKAFNYFGKGGKMIDRKGQRIQNTTITAIGFIKQIAPDAIISGYNDRLSKLAEGMDVANDENVKKYFAEADKLENNFNKKGFNIKKQALSVNFIINPYARKSFPERYFFKPHNYAYQYNLKNGEIKLVYDWANSKKSL
jgi:hypothetical protein